MIEDILKCYTTFGLYTDITAIRFDLLEFAYPNYIALNDCLAILKAKKMLRNNWRSRMVSIPKEYSTLKDQINSINGAEFLNAVNKVVHGSGKTKGVLDELASIFHQGRIEEVLKEGPKGGFGMPFKCEELMEKINSLFLMLESDEVDLRELKEIYGIQFAKLKIKWKMEKLVYYLERIRFKKKFERFYNLNPRAHSIFEKTQDFALNIVKNINNASEFDAMVNEVRDNMNSRIFKRIKPETNFNDIIQGIFEINTTREGKLATAIFGRAIYSFMWEWKKPGQK